MQKKRSLMFFVFVFIASFMFFFVAQSVSACQENQRIMRLSSASNAHAESYNGTGNYPVEICYDEIFGLEFSGANPHSCNGNNLVIKLSAGTNSHAEIAGKNNYQTDICYGNLECRNTITSCGSNEKLIATLSSETNAHLAPENYPVNICCKPEAEVEGKMEKAYWLNMKGEKISKSELKDRVQLAVSGENLKNFEVEFSVYKSVKWWFDKKVAESSSLIQATWRVGMKNDSSFESGDYYFKARIDGMGELISGNLHVSEIINNSKPVARIISPKEGVYFREEIISFIQESYDEDDFFNYTWNFGDGNLAYGSSRTYANYNLNYSYNFTGQRGIILEAKDERGLEDSDRSYILVIMHDEKYVFAKISKPGFGEGILGKNVDFDATSSYAIKLDGNITCIAGNCPEKTFNKTEIIKAGNWQNLESIYFVWNFSDNTKREGFGMNNSLFLKTFANPGKSYAKLTARFNALSSSARTEFILYFEEPYCYIDKNGDGFWLESGTLTSSFSDCYRQVVASGSKTCCPSEYSCKQQGSGYKCSIGGEVLTSKCSEYNKTECSSYSQDVARDDVEAITKIGYCSMTRDLGNNCQEIVANCRCEWSSSESKCAPRYDINEKCENQPEQLSGFCTFTTLEDTNCTEGYRFIKWMASWNGTGEKDEICENGKKAVPCISESLLSFFSPLNIVAAAAIIIIFYLAYFTNFRKQADKKKKR